MTKHLRPEAQGVLDRYARRNATYSIYEPENYLRKQELERALIKALVRIEAFSRLADLCILEIGCGDGSNLLEFIKLGFNPEKVLGNELQESRIVSCAKKLPGSVRIFAGDALDLDLEESSIDIVFQSLVFSSILDTQTRFQLAEKMWSLAKPGGGILWYDFTFNNPKNSDVKKVTISDIRQLFPNGNVESVRVTLAPPLARIATKVHPSLYGFLNVVPFLRTHLLCWIPKPTRS